MSKISYNLKLIKGIVFDVDGVLSPSTIPLLPDGTPSRMVNIKDGYALQLAIKMGYKIAIITGADTEAIKVRFNGLGITDVFLKTSVKITCLKKWMEDNNLAPEEVAFAGDDVPDYECMNYVGLSVAPSDAASDILDIAKYISPVKGGEGVGRDLLEQIMRNNGQWLSSEKAFGW
ncbi:MAG: HAD hydrolase family protein [Muribaculaceae bacterium]|nr:HAD hydrolase family protein [Muribaculaceae bacterium]MBQ7853913.1 HAD hydrolase family protein [Muribaculaceae bacterium]